MTGLSTEDQIDCFTNGQFVYRHRQPVRLLFLTARLFITRYMKYAERAPIPALADQLSSYSAHTEPLPPPKKVWHTSHRSGPY